MSRTDKVAALASEALRALYVFETNPENAGLANRKWTTPDARKARLAALNKADAWSVKPGVVTVSGWHCDSDPAMSSETSRRIYGAVADAAEFAAVAAGLEGWTVEAISPYAVAIRWDDADQGSL